MNQIPYKMKQVSKKTFCENIEGTPMWGLCKQDSYHESELQTDHKDGNPYNNDPDNIWTICSNCHQRKTDFMGDRLTSGRYTKGMPNNFCATTLKHLEKIFDGEEYTLLRKSIRSKYFFLPFKDAYENGELNLLEGPVGFGKTYGIFVEMAPYHFAQGGRIHIATSPMKDSQGYDEILDYVLYQAKYADGTPLPRFHHSDTKGGINWIQVNEQLESGHNVTIVMSDQYLNMSDNIDKVEKLVSQYKTLLTRDEASYAMLSSWEISKTVLGHNYPEDTKQSFFNNFKRLYTAGAIEFGITATPTKEMRETILGEDWNITNEIPNNHEMVPFRKWYRHLQIADWSHDDYGDEEILEKEMNGLFQKVTTANIMVSEFNEKYNCSHFKQEKVTGMIVTQPNQGSRELIRPIDIVEFISGDKSIMSTHHTLIVTDASGWVEYDSNGDKVSSGKGQEYQSMLKSSDHSAHYLVVINKAVYGVNINTLGFGLIFRQYQNEDEQGFSITISAEQLLGRWNRVNFLPEKIVDLAKNFGNHSVHEYLSIPGIGCFDVKAPKSQQYETAFQNFKENHGTHIMDACSYLFDY